MGCSYAIRNCVELGSELGPGPDLYFRDASEKLKPCKTLRAIVAERTCRNVMVEERREPAETGVGNVKSRIWP